MTRGIAKTDFHFPKQLGKYTGKVRDVYHVGDKLVMVASDRISAFDVVLPHPIPYKGQVLNQVAAKFLEATSDLVPNWVLTVPDPNVTIGLKCDPFPIEMVIRGYLAGHAWREYRSGKREICGNILPDGLRENDPLPSPIITPTTKAHQGHDEDIAPKEILAQGMIDQSDYDKLEAYTFALFAKGTEMAKAQGLILVDTKYEFGRIGDTIYLIDEVHTPDSSRYFYADTYEALQRDGQPQRQLSKEFVRQWLIENRFQGQNGQKIPEMPEAFIQTVSERYIELYEKITGEPFVKSGQVDLLDRIEKNTLAALN